MMSLDTNNNVGIEDNDGTSEEEDEQDDDDEEDEPVFKYSPITVSSALRRSTEDTRNLSPEFSCIAVHEKFLVIGKVTGEILITDPQGVVTSHDPIKAVIRPRSTHSNRSSLSLFSSTTIPSTACPSMTRPISLAVAVRKAKYSAPRSSDCHDRLSSSR